jgi:hypothetical protein
MLIFFACTFFFLFYSLLEKYKNSVCKLLFYFELLEIIKKFELKKNVAIFLKC